MLDLSCAVPNFAGRKAAKGAKSLATNHESSDELLTALSELELSPHKDHIAKPIALKTKPASTLYVGVQEHSIIPLSEACTKCHTDCADEVPPLSERLKSRPRNNMECVDDNISSVADKLKTVSTDRVESLSSEQLETNSTHQVDCSDCDEIPPLAMRLKIKSGNHSSYPINTSAIAEHNRCNATLTQTQEGNEEVILISDNSSESEGEDALQLSHRDGAHTMMASLQHQYCNSSEGESSSDEALSPLINQIGTKRQGTSSSPLKTKLSPTKDFVSTKAVQSANNARRKLFLSGGSAESPIEID